MRKLLLMSLVLLAALVFVGVGCTTKTTTTTTPTVVPTTVTTETNGQWAATASASSEYGDLTNGSWTAYQATGQPNVSEYGDNGSAWAPKEKNKGAEWLETTFNTPVNATSVKIKESYGSGAITKVELKDATGKYYEVWSGADTTRGLNFMTVSFEKTTYKVAAVKVTFDTTKVPSEWAEIDAVQLIGTK